MKKIKRGRKTEYIYEVYKNNEKIYEGTSVNLARKFGVSKETVYSEWYKKCRFLGEYRLERKRLNED